jgi:hypothetical protein
MANEELNKEFKNKVDKFYKNKDILTTEDLKTTPSADFTTFEEPTVPKIEVPELPAQELTETEGQVQTGMEDIAELNKQLLGESELRTEKEEEQGMPELIQTQTDLQSRIKTLAEEQKSIPLQIQQESIGRGRTAGGVAPIQTARLRENAINALSTNALLSATQGNIATAQTLIDRAVSAKYDPIREEIRIEKENLQMIIDSPQFSLEQKKRAEERKAIVDKRNAQISKDEADEKSILDIATQVAKFGVPMEVLQAIRDARSPLEATAIAQSTGVYDTEKIQQEFENSLKTGEFNLKKQKLLSDIEQQAIDNEMSIMNLELDRDKYATDTEFRNANLALDTMKANYTVDKMQADIDKIYAGIEKDKLPSVDEQIKIDKLQDAKLQKTKDEEVERNAQRGEITTLETKLALIKSITDNETGLKNVVGTNLLGRLGFDPLSGNAQFVSGKVRQLVDKEVLDTLVNLKSRGGTLGAISEKELEILGNSATAINGWATKSGKRWNISEDEFKEELKRLGDSAQRLIDADEADQEARIKSGGFKDYDDFLDYGTDEQVDFVQQMATDYPGISDDQVLDLLNESLGKTSVGSDTNTALPKEVSEASAGDKGGQCGRFVNKHTGLGVGDSFASKMAKMDSSITEPEPGMVFTIPYKDTGHCGFVVGVEGDNVIVKDSNWGLDEKVKTHKIPKFKIAGYARV